MDFDYSAHYEKMRDGVEREFKAKFIGYAGNNIYAVEVGHGDFKSLVTAFLFDCGVTSMMAMTDNTHHLKNLEDSAGLLYAFGSIEHKTSEEAFRKILKKYRGYAKEFKSRCDA